MQEFKQILENEWNVVIEYILNIDIPLFEKMLNGTTDFT